MESWQRLANEVKTDPALRHLTEKQVEAVVDVLLLTIHADQQVSFMEEAELEHMLAELPWSADKDERMPTYIREATQRLQALAAEGRERLRTVAESSAAALVDEKVREKVYRMAAELAGIDVAVNDMERDVLTWLADCFEIPESRRVVLR
jgi:hypothetical protein